MKVQVSKWGNSLAIRLPKSIAEEAGIAEGSTLDIAATDGQVTLVKDRRASLADLLSRITAENIHEEIGMGEARGNEVW